VRTGGTPGAAGGGGGGKGGVRKMGGGGNAELNNIMGWAGRWVKVKFLLKEFFTTRVPQKKSNSGVVHKKQSFLTEIQALLKVRRVWVNLGILGEGGGVSK